MRVCFVSPQIPSGAYGRRGYSFLRVLAESNHEITLHCLEDSGPCPDARAELAELGIDIRPATASKVARWSSCLVGLLGPTPLRVLHCESKQLHRNLVDDLSSSEYDVLHFDRFRTAPYAQEARSFFSGPIVIDFPDCLSLYYERALENPRRGFLGWVDRREARVIPPYENQLLRAGYHYLVCSDVDRSRLLDVGPEAKIEVIPHRIDTVEFAPRDSDEPREPRLVFTGTLYYLPNIDALQWLQREIIPLVRSCFDPIDVIGFGATRELDSVQTDTRFDFRGYVENMADHLFQNDIYLCPLRIGAGLRNKLLEAFASGMAVISTTLGYEGINCKPGYHLLVADTPEEFVAAIDRLLEDGEERQRLGQNARDLVCSEYSQEAFASNVERYYCGLVGT